MAKSGDHEVAVRRRRRVGAVATFSMMPSSVTSAFWIASQTPLSLTWTHLRSPLNIIGKTMSRISEAPGVTFSQ